jgi:hypothetical protein
MIGINGYLYEEAFKYDDKLSEYSNYIRILVYKAIHDKIFKINKKYLISDLAKRYSEQPIPELSDLGIYFANTVDYFYNQNNKTLILPKTILQDGLTKKDLIAISHELEHYFQFKSGTFKDEGTYTNEKNKGSSFAYENDSNEINARLSQINSYIGNAPKFKAELGGYDFQPFVEEVISKILYYPDATDYLDNMLSEDNRNKVLAYLYSLWKKIKN